MVVRDTEFGDDDLLFSTLDDTCIECFESCHTSRLRGLVDIMRFDDGDISDTHIQGGVGFLHAHFLLLHHEGQDLRHFGHMLVYMPISPWTVKLAKEREIDTI